jgi:hypothetical protein
MSDRTGRGLYSNRFTPNTRRSGQREITAEGNRQSKSGDCWGGLAPMMLEVQQLFYHIPGNRRN